MFFTSGITGLYWSLRARHDQSTMAGIDVNETMQTIQSTVPVTHLQPINCFVPASEANSKCVSRSAAILLSVS